MGRDKQRKKNSKKQKRIKKIRIGKYVPFSLANHLENLMEELTNMNIKLIYII